MSPKPDAWPPVDVHDPTISAADVAQRIDELAGALTYATRVGDPRLRGAADAYRILGVLQETLTKLPQVCAQIAVFLDRQLGAGALVAEDGFAHAGAPGRAVAVAAAALDRAAGFAIGSSTALGRAHDAISGLSQVPPERARPASTPQPPRLLPGAFPCPQPDAPTLER
jgi:hypothetical protein